MSLNCLKILLLPEREVKMLILGSDKSSRYVLISLTAIKMVDSEYNLQLAHGKYQ